MDTSSQLKAVDRFLAAIYGGPFTLASLLDELGFDPQQARWLCEQRMPALAAALVDALRLRLASGEKDLWFRLLSRRYGLDGDPALSLDETARLLGLDAGYASQAQSSALEKCRTRAVLDGLRHDLHNLALAELKQFGQGPTPEDVAGKLKRLADLRAAQDMTRLDYEAKRAEVLKQVQAELDALEGEYQPLIDSVEEKASALADEIKNDVLQVGETVSTDLYQAVYVRGRVSWDSAGITRYAESHPDVLKFRKVGDPTVALRELGRD